MPKSMTGFGRSVIDVPFGQLIVEIQSVNRKHFEASLQLPRDLFRFEHKIRKWIGSKVFRGHLSVRIQLLPSKDTVANLLPDTELLRSVKIGWETLSKDMGLDPSQVTLPFITSVMPQVEKKDVFEDEAKFQECIESALKNLLNMREEEGKALVVDIHKYLSEIEQNVGSIEKLIPNTSDKMRKKLTEKMHALFEKDESLDERIFKEIALFAEKVDIAEEITRLKAHFEQFKKCLQVDTAVGRKMEFVLQEIAREINTIGSKSLDANIAYLVVESKSAVEKIREQIQNIE